MKDQTFTFEQVLAIIDYVKPKKQTDLFVPDLQPESSVKSFGHAIVVADRGHVWVGDITVDNDWCLIKSARAIRFWGTTKGLNQLANEGPQSGTKLDAAADLRINMKALIAIIPTKERWV